MNLTLEEWDELGEDEQLLLVHRVQSALPSGFSFQGICDYQLGGMRHAVANFDFQGSKFVLVPGGEVTIGFDESREWIPSLEERESWDSTAAEYDIEYSIDTYIQKVTLRPRVVALKPMLMESRTQEMGWIDSPLDAPEVLEALRDFEKYPELGSTEHVSDVSVRVKRDQTSGFIAQRSDELTHADIVNAWKRAGMRLPTSDEWEYACGGGAETLFRWGDHVPCDRNPTDHDAPSSWDLHRRPNMFGLSIAFNPYQFELVAESNLTRGGDGGSTICGGAGYFVSWLTLATSYFDTHKCERNPQEPILAGFTFARRVLSLD